MELSLRRLLYKGCGNCHYRAIVGDIDAGSEVGERTGQRASLSQQSQAIGAHMDYVGMCKKWGVPTASSRRGAQKHKRSSLSKLP